MHPTRSRRWRALVVLLALTVGCTAAGAQDAAPTTTAPPTTTTTLSPAAQTWLAGIARAELERRAFLEGVAAMRAAVPLQLRRIMWCEAGRYLKLPRYSTNYRAMTHGYDGASGGAQMLGSTWVTWAREVGVDVARWPRAFLAPDFVQDHVATHGYLTRGTAPWNPSAGCWS